MAREIILPTRRREAQNYNPRLMVVFGRPKMGKSSAMASLDDNLIADLEQGYRALNVMSVDIKDAYDLFAMKTALEKKMAELKGKHPYRFITIDNATRLEEMCVALANSKYRKTQMGSQWGILRDKDNLPLRDKNNKFIPDPKADVRQLPQGAGYFYMREALKEVIHMFLPYCETLILVCHVKDKQIRLDNTESTEYSVDLAGKLSDIICGEADAVGFIYREKNKTYITFEGGDGTVREARSPHLRGKRFVIGESDESGVPKFDMSKIFLDG